MFSACASAAISKTRRAGNWLRECQCVTADGVIPSIMANFLFPPSAAITLDISNSLTFQAPIKFYNPTDRKITKCKYYQLNYFTKFTKSSLLDEMDALSFNRISSLVKTHCGLPPWKKARITMPATKTSDVRYDSGGLYVSASSWQDCPTGPPYTNFKKSASSLRRQGWGENIAWTIARIIAPSVVVRRCTTRDGAGGDTWINPENGPPKTLVGKFIDRARTATSSKPIPVNDACLSSDSGGTDWKKRENDGTKPQRIEN